MNTPQPTKATVWQNGNAVLLARARVIDGTYLRPAIITSAVLTVYDQDNSMAVVYGPVTLTVAAVTFATLQTDPILWPVDNIGYNFRYELAGAAFPLARNYRVDVLFTQTSGNRFPLQYDLPARAVP